jgi:pimeloyl-ACP methyl ester carboxylesterase
VFARLSRWWHPSTTPRRVVAWVVRRIYGVRGQWTERDVDEYWLPLRRSDVVQAILQSVREFDFVPRDPSSVVVGGRPLVIRFGELDGLIPAEAAVKHAAQIAGADTAVLRGVGHVPADEIPEEIADLISRTVTRVT